MTVYVAKCRHKVLVRVFQAAKIACRRYTGSTPWGLQACAKTTRAREGYRLEATMNVKVEAKMSTVVHLGRVLAVAHAAAVGAMLGAEGLDLVQEGLVAPPLPDRPLLLAVILSFPNLRPMYGAATTATTKIMAASAAISSIATMMEVV